MVVSFVKEDRGEAMLIGINLHRNDYLSVRQIKVFPIAAEKLDHDRESLITGLGKAIENG